MVLDLKDYIGSYPDFPEKGVMFRDISPLLEDGEAFHQATDEIVQFAKRKNADVIVGPEARGFIVGCPVAYQLDIGFVPARKKGKLPGKTMKESYGLEYGQAELYMHEEAIKPGQKVILTDDLMATGGTIAATKRLVEKMGGEVVGAAFMVELMDLKGRDKLGDTDILSLVKYN